MTSLGRVSDEAFENLLTSVNRGVLVTLKSDGRPQLSNVSHHYDPSSRLLRISVTESRAKTRNLRRDPRASYHVTSANFYHWVVAEGTASLSAVATEPDDAAVAELIDLYRAISGEHPDWDEYRRAMVAEARLVARVQVERCYGQVS